MKIEYEDSQDTYSRYCFDKAKRSFVLYTEESSEIEYRPILEIQPEYEPDHFHDYLLYNYSEKCGENSIFQAYVDDVRIGWLFPIQSLFSKDHDFIENEYFLKYAYVAICKLLDRLKVNEKHEPEELELEEYYNDTTLCMLLCDDGNCKEIGGFNIDDYTISLYKYGYWHEKIEKYSSGEYLDLECFPTGNVRIHLKSISSELSTEPYILNLFGKYLPGVNNEIVRFYFLYQIVEILIGRVFEFKFNRILSRINTGKYNLFNIRAELLNESDEKRRINVLFSQFVKADKQHYATDLRVSCELFLKHHNQEIKGNHNDNLYAVRCFLVHQLYSLDPESLNLLKEINRDFILFLIDALFAYQSPT